MSDVNTIPETRQSKPTQQQPLRNNHDIQRFKLNHPKNYLAVPLAVACDESTDFLLREFAVNLPQRAINGAIETGLITETLTVTPLGQAVISTAVQSHDDIHTALTAIGELHGSQKRFTDIAPEWEHVAKRVAFQYDVTQAIASFLREQGALSLQELTWLLWKYDSALAEAVFLHPSVTAELSITPDSQPPSRTLRDSSMYRSECTFQFKAFLFHAGVITERGDYTSALNPGTDTWELRN